MLLSVARPLETHPLTTFAPPPAQETEALVVLAQEVVTELELRLFAGTETWRNMKDTKTAATRFRVMNGVLRDGSLRPLLVTASGIALGNDWVLRSLCCLSVLPCLSGCLFVCFLFVSFRFLFFIRFF
jgi:hypothetical protein